MLAVIRLIILFCYFLLVNVALLIICAMRPLHRNNVYIAGKFYSSMVGILGVKLVHRRNPNIETNQSYIFIGNHQNSYDIITLSRAAEPGVVTIGKKSLKWLPIFGQIYWLSGNIMIDRKNTGKAMNTLVLAAEKMRKRNLSVWIFPEGTRNKSEGLLPFKTGAFRLALAEGKQIVPVVCSELNNKKIKLNRWNNGTVIIETMDIIQPKEGISAKELAEQTRSAMLETLERINLEAERGIVSEQ